MRSTSQDHIRWSALSAPLVRTSLWLLGFALIGIWLADLEIRSIDPWTELARFGSGLIRPDFATFDTAVVALLRTLAFAFTGVGVAAIFGMGLALVFHNRVVRIFCAIVRAIHELFWALIFLQFFGLHPVTGVLAIALPYAATFARVYSEILEEGDRGAERALPANSSIVSRFWYVRVPDLWAHLLSYTSYRFECGMRSSAVLGFVGMPTLGFYLESSYAEGQYGEVGMILLIFLLTIGSLRLWLRPKLVFPYLLVAPFFLGTGLPIVWGNATRFFTEDIIPAPIRNSEGIAGFVAMVGRFALVSGFTRYWYYACAHTNRSGWHWNHCSVKFSLDFSVVFQPLQSGGRARTFGNWPLSTRISTRIHLTSTLGTFYVASSGRLSNSQWRHRWSLNWPPK